MIGVMRPITTLALLLPLAACGPNDTDPGPGGVTVAEARALDEAAEMVEARRLPPEALEEEGTAPAGAPAANGNSSPAPSPSAGE